MRARTDGKSELLFADRWRPRRKIAPPPHRRGHVALVEVRGAISSGRTRRGPFGRAGRQRHRVCTAACGAR